MGGVDQIIEKLTVPRLADLAFSASFKELLGSHSSHQRHQSKGKLLCSSTNVISFVRSRLEQFPVGINSKIRYESLKLHNCFLNT